MPLVGGYKTRISYIVKIREKKLLDLVGLHSIRRIKYSGRSGKEEEGGREKLDLSKYNIV